MDHPLSLWLRRGKQSNREPGEHHMPSLPPICEFKRGVETNKAMDEVWIVEDDSESFVSAEREDHRPIAHVSDGYEVAADGHWCSSSNLHRY